MIRQQARIKLTLRDDKDAMFRLAEARGVWELVEVDYGDDDFPTASISEMLDDCRCAPELLVRMAGELSGRGEVYVSISGEGARATASLVHWDRPGASVMIDEAKVNADMAERLDAIRKLATMG